MTGYYNINDEYRLKHFQVPKVFFTNEDYLKMSNDTKLAWAILKDRFSLSVKNGWYDEQGNIFFLFNNQALMEILHKSEPTVVKIKKELIKNGLLEQKRTGLNQANKLYLKQPNVTAKDIYSIDEQEKEPSNTSAPTELKNFKVKNLNNLSSRTKNSLGQELKNFKPNDIEISNTDLNNTEFSNHHHYLMKVGFTNRQAQLISRFALDNKIKPDDDDFHILVNVLKEYKQFNSIEYIVKTYNSLMNQETSTKVTRNTKNELNDLKSFWQKQKEEQGKKNALTDSQQEHEEVSRLLQELKANTK